MTLPGAFETERLSARRVSERDLPYVIEVDRDPIMAHWLSGSISTRAESHARLERWLDEERATGLGFWIFYAANEPIGHGGLFTSKREPGSIELGYAILPKYWGRGYATEIARSFLALARSEGVHRIVALTRPANERSKHVLEKCGLQFTGRIHVAGTEYVRYVAT